MFFGCFHCWLHLFISPTLGFLQVFSFHKLFLLLFFINFLYHDCFFVLFCFLALRFCVAVPRVLWIWEESFSYSQTFFISHSFRTFGTTCFYQGFPGSQQFFFKGCRASNRGSKHRPSPSVCLNHTVFSKRN